MGRNIDLIEKLKDQNQRLWYAQQTIANGWSRSMLLHWIDSDLFARQGEAVTSFQRTLPAPQSDLAQQLLKDPYNFDFLTLATDAHEREAKAGLTAHIRQFLLELGFAFVGRQYPLEVGGEEFSIDLLASSFTARRFSTACGFFAKINAVEIEDNARLFGGETELSLVA